MTIPMPRQLRVFDHVEDQYRIWAIVRYMKPSIVDNGTCLTSASRSSESVRRQVMKKNRGSVTTFQHRFSGES